MKKIIFYGFIILILSACAKNNVSESSDSQSYENDTIAYLSNQSAKLGVNIFGGAYVDFRLNDSINPYTWHILPKDMPENNRAGAPFAGHFLCLGRWGSPTEGEIKAGVPHNGEATNTWWKVEQKTSTYLKMTNNAPLDGMYVQREITMHETLPVFYVKETIENVTSVGRLNNIVQHATIGEPFLDTNTIINTNAGEGFLQKYSYPNPYAYEYKWPNGIIDSLKTPLNLEETKTEEGYVTTHIYNDKYGWITAYNPEMGKVLGFIWKTDEYKWSNIWHCFVDGKPWAKGLEFGTTGIGRSYQDLLAVDTRFHGVPSFEFLDAKEKVEKSFLSFYFNVEKNLNGVEEVTFEGDNAILKFRNSDKTVSIPLMKLKGTSKN